MSHRRLAWPVLVAFAASAALAAGTTQPAQTFRSGVELIEVDVSVIDGDARPLADLPASDPSRSRSTGSPAPLLAGVAHLAPGGFLGRARVVLHDAVEVARILRRFRIVGPPDR